MSGLKIVIVILILFVQGRKPEGRGEMRVAGSPKVKVISMQWLLYPNLSLSSLKRYVCKVSISLARRWLSVS